MMRTTSYVCVTTALYLLLLVTFPAAADFSDLYKGSFVQEVDPNNFHEMIMEFPGVVLLQFYTTWSPNCKKLAPKWVEAAEVLKAEGSSVRIAKFDADTHREFARRFKLEGYPTLASFGKFTKELPTYELSSDASVDDIVDHAKQLDAVTEEEADSVMREVRKTKRKGSVQHKKTSDNGAGAKSSSDSGVKKSLKKKSKSSKKEKKEHSASPAPSPGKKGHKDKRSRASPTEAVRPPKPGAPSPPPPPSRPDVVHNEGPGVEGLSDGTDHHAHHHRHRPPIIDPINHHDILGAGAGAAPGTPLRARHRFPHPHGAAPDEEREDPRQDIPPRSPEDDAKHDQLVKEHWERVQRRKEERDERRGRGESNEHDDMYFKHEQMITDARRRHDDHMAEVMRRHDEVMNNVRKRMDDHRANMDRRLGSDGPALTPAEDSVVTLDGGDELPASVESADAL
jgi:thioredoxin 1